MDKEIITIAVRLLLLMIVTPTVFVATKWFNVPINVVIWVTVW
jgi:hypothetical protein